MKNLKSEPNPVIDQKILDDYFAFFTTEEGADILPYFYIENSHLFDELVKNSENYYVFRDEVKLIKDNKDILSNYLSDVSNIVEIGPGSFHSIENKTLPMLSYAKNLKNYYAVDFCEKYLSDACNFIKSNTQNFEISAVKADFIEDESIGISNSANEKKAIIFLGGTFTDYSDDKQEIFLKKITKVTNEGDLFILAIDINDNEKSLIDAYSDDYSLRLCFACLEYFATINPYFAKYINLFEVKCAWNEKSRFVDIFFVVTEDLTFYYHDYGNIVLKKKQELRGIKSRKPKAEYITTILKKNDFDILDVLSDNNSVKLMVCKRR